jgi:hypothetical protein
VALFRLTKDDLAFAARASIIHATYCSGLEDALPELARRGRVSFDFSDHLDDGYADDLVPFVHVAANRFSARRLHGSNGHISPAGRGANYARAKPRFRTGAAN